MLVPIDRVGPLTVPRSWYTSPPKRNNLSRPVDILVLTPAKTRIDKADPPRSENRERQKCHAYPMQSRHHHLPSKADELRTGGPGFYCDHLEPAYRHATQTRPRPRPPSPVVIVNHHMQRSVASQSSHHRPPKQAPPTWQKQTSKTQGQAFLKRP